MNPVEKLRMNYVGYSNPNGEEEINFEVLGLETVIAQAKQRIAILNQSLKLSEIMSESVVEDEENEETITETSDTEEIKSEIPRE